MRKRKKREIRKKSKKSEKNIGIKATRSLGTLTFPLRKGVRERAKTKEMRIFNLFGKKFPAKRGKRKNKSRHLRKTKKNTINSL